MTSPMTTSMDLLYDLAEPRAGYFTTAHAAAHGVSRQQLYYLAHRGAIERVAHGIYRLRRFPSQRFEDVIVACLWAGDDAVASHDTALAIYDLTDAMPAHTHLTLPRPFRGRRPGVIVHQAPLPDADRAVRHGVPVTAAPRTIKDVADHKGPAAAAAAAAEALERGLLTRRQLERALRATADAPPNPVLQRLRHER